MRTVAIVLLVLSAACALAQTPLQVVSTSPANNATSVATGHVNISFTFNLACDTTIYVSNGSNDAGFIANVDTLYGVTFSPDKRTVTYSVYLSAGKYYFACVFAGKTSTGTAMDHPYAFYFTTAASFPATTVGGTVSAGSTGISTAYSLVVLSLTPIGAGGSPAFAAGAIADAGGAFSVPHVPNGYYYSIAARDLNNDGAIDPGRGDIVGVGPDVTVSSTNIVGLTITFLGLSQPNYKEAIDSLNAHIASFPSPRTLRSVQTYEVDTTGRGGWQFYYTGSTRQTSFEFRVEPFGSGTQTIDSINFFWLTQMKPIASLPTVAAVDSFFARAERAGGKAYRPVPQTWNGFQTQIAIGQLSRQNYWDMVSDTSQLYLGITYAYGIDNLNQWTTLAQRRFLGRYSDGLILGTTGVGDNTGGEMPGRFALDQNYPNPFNPSTVIGYSLPADGRVTLTVYNVLGQKVATLVNGPVSAGNHQVEWRAQVSSGIYFYRMEASASGNSAQRFIQTRKMILMK